MKKKRIKKNFLKYLSIFILLLYTKTVYSGTFEGDLNIYVIGSDCSLDFREGWNLFSFCRNLNESNSILSSIENEYRYLMWWNSTTQEFEIYSPRSSQPLPTLNDNESYFIYYYNTKILNVSGETPVNESRELTEGWNAPSYQSNFIMYVTEIIDQIGDKLRYIMKWNSTTQEFEIYSPRSSRNPFDRINPKEGYFIYSQNQSTIFYQ